VLFRRILSSFIILYFVQLFAALADAPGDAMAYLSPVSIAADPGGAQLYIAEATANQIAVFDIAAQRVSKTIALPDPPAGIAIAPDGARLYVAGAVPAGRLHIVDLPRGEIRASLPAGHTPTAVAVSSDDTRLYVCNRFDDTVSVFDLDSHEQVASVAVSREPVAAALTPDGARLVVANLLPVGPSDGDYTAAIVTVIDTSTLISVAEIALPNGSTGLRGVCVSPDGAYAYVTHLLGRYHLPTTQLERGWMNTNALSIIDVLGGRRVNTVLLDSVDRGAANPWGVACSLDGALICVTHAGAHELSVLDRPALHDRLAKVAAGEAVSEVSLCADDVPNDLAFLVGIQRRIRLSGNGPRGLAVIGSRVYAAEYFSGTLGVVDLAVEGASRVQSISLGVEPLRTQERIGEMFFNDAALCFQHWQSCASCHPDARADGLNWDLLNDGIGNPKNTRSMLLSHRTPPVMSLGVRETAESAVRSGIRYIQFAERPEEDAAAIDAYLKSLPPTPSPALINGQRSAAAERGAQVFQQAGCAACHPAPLFTNLMRYRVGTGRDLETDKEFDTPTLVEAWRTAPYLHDGRSKSLRDVFTTDNPADQHGVTSTLTAEQINDLVEFVRSL